eukprot:SAG31_NODE_269_length_18741_cov_11.185441_2_plen_219_part_00
MSLITERHRLLEDKSKDNVRRAQSVDDRPLCFGNADASVGDGTRCGGRRQLDSDEKDEEIRQLKAKLEKSKGEAEAAIQRTAEKDTIVLQQAKTIKKQANEIAFHKRLHRLRQSAVNAHNDSDSTRRNQTAVGRRTQAIGSSDSSILRLARVGPDHSVKACAAHPCELSDELCQNGGTCIEGVAEGNGVVPFECQCARNFVGLRCETDLCAGVDWRAR